MMETLGIGGRILRSRMTEKPLEKKEANQKRSAEGSPDSASKKRSVLCNITNANPVSIACKSQKYAKGKNVKVSNDDEIFMDCDSQEPESLVTNVKIKQEDSVICIDSDDDDSFLKPVPAGVKDFDSENANDIYSESHNAPYIFHYYKQRESKFIIEKYMHRQRELSQMMRAVLVDWLVEVQESFELNHETLYLAVKLVDIYLMKNIISKNNLQLVGATAIFIASKYDERMPPLVDDILYICDDSYTREELLQMEISILHCVDFDLGIPLSYRFLRRYSRCSGITMDTLTLARYILETALMDYEYVGVADSKMAAAVLLLALKMKNLGGWTATLMYYSGYESDELMSLVKSLNKMISAPLNTNLLTVHTKYSHKIFFQVAKIPPLSDIN